MALLPILIALLSLQSASAASIPDKVSSTWFAGWHNDMGFAVSNISWSKYTDVIWSFAETTPDAHVLSLNGSEPEALPQFVTQAHRHGVKARIAVGGWTGSRFFSSNMATSENRTIFAKTVVNLVKQYNFDGINIDWEFPTAAGIGCNTALPKDTTNLLAFLKELRKDPVGKNMIITAAVSLTPWADADGNSLTDVSAFAKELDYIEIMNYDVNGPWSTAVGPNAPINDTCTPPDFQAGSAVLGINSWHSAGMPLHQIVLGVPSYGHSFRVTQKDAFQPHSTSKLALYAPFNATDQPAGDAWDDASGIDECGNFSPQGGNIDFWGMVTTGFLTTKGVPAPGIAFIRDSCAETPYVYNSKTEVMVSYDDVESFAAKGRFIKNNGLRGFAMWEAGGDMKDMLLDSIREAAGCV